MILPPPKLENLKAGSKLKAGLGESTIIADLDFETYSPAGFVWDDASLKFKPPHGAAFKGLPVVGAAVYTEHPDAEVLSLAYDLKDGKGKRLWLPGTDNSQPWDLLYYVKNGGLLEAWNVTFEKWVWNNICVPKYGWLRLPLSQLRCAAAKSRAHALPGSLDPAGEVVNIKNKKIKDGKRLLTKFSIPRNPTKNDPRLRILPSEDLKDEQLLYQYNLRDIEAEAELSSLTPDLIASELEFWQCDLAINDRGVQIDTDMISNCISVIEQAYAKYDRELSTLTNNFISHGTEIQKIKIWMKCNGFDCDSLDAGSIIELLARGDLPTHISRVLEIRELIGSAAVKKLYAMQNQVTRDGRLHDLFVYHSARTGRAAGTGPQPQNLPNSGPLLVSCDTCKKHHTSIAGCPWCGSPGYHGKDIEWNHEGVKDALEVIETRSNNCVEYFFGDSISVVAGCLRGLFVSKPNHDLICSDYSAIEAVVLAALAGEEWRLEVFRTHGKIYEMSASKITGIDFEEFNLYKATTSNHHPMRKKIGKVAELASGYGGWIGAWKAFGADEFFNDDEIKSAILAWRKASPAIVEFWGGQQKYWQTEYYGLEGMAVLATMHPGTKFSYKAISYLMSGDALYCELPSGRFITYHRPRLEYSDRRPGTMSLSFEGWNSNPKNGAMGWIRMQTYGGKLCENVVQAVARDLLANAIILLEKAKYPVVLHIHDEIVAEIPEIWGSIAEFEEIMSTMPVWAQDWPVKARGGWRDKRYRK